MVKREIMLLTVCALFVAYVPFTSYHFNITSQLEMTSILKSAYGQTPGPGDPGNAVDPGNPSDPGNIVAPGNLGGPDPSAGDNSTNLSNPGDVSSGIGNSTNVITQNYTSSGPDATIPVPGDLGNHAENATTAQVVPEFGPISILILTTAIVSIILISTRVSNFHK